MFRIAFLILFSVLCLFTTAQVKYYNADQFPLIGKISNETETRYERLPACLKTKCRKPVWSLGKNTAGLAVRFRTNSTSISLQWDLLNNTIMNHMAFVGIKGLDLYVWVDNKWAYANSARPTGVTNRADMIRNMTSQDREYLLYLPLYDGVTSLSIGVDSLSTIEQPKINSPDTSRPIVLYGTSITQGGCASRPGMAYSNILSRWLNREVINLGFSGNGKLDYEIAEFIATKEDASLFILDFVGNNTPEQILARTIPFVRIIRQKNPNTPILLIERATLKSDFNRDNYNSRNLKNMKLRAVFEQLAQSGDKNLYYLEGEGLIGTDGEATVDGGHFTDLGFLRFAEALYAKLKMLNL